MYRDKTIGLVIPAYNESKLIVPTLEHVPDLIDHIFVVDDASTDGMADVVRTLAEQDTRITLIVHETNQGPGAGIITGYRRASDAGCDVTVVVGGDYQMPLECVTDFLDPVISGEVDYTKGNRFVTGKGAFDRMPKTRLVGNMIISALTKIASGYYKIVDVVDGYTAISKRAIDAIQWDEAWKGYGYPMDFLIQLNMRGFKVRDVPRDAVYLEGERQSQIKGVRYALRVSPMLLRGFLWRITNRYLFRSFHPLFFFYVGGLLLTPIGAFYSMVLVFRQYVSHVGVTPSQSVLCALLLIMGVQFLLFAMLFDMQESS